MISDSVSFDITRRRTREGRMEAIRRHSRAGFGGGDYNDLFAMALVEALQNWSDKIFPQAALHTEFNVAFSVLPEAMGKKERVARKNTCCYPAVTGWSIVLSKRSYPVADELSSMASSYSGANPTPHARAAMSVISRDTGRVPVGRSAGRVNRNRPTSGIQRIDAMHRLSRYQHGDSFEIEAANSRPPARLTQGRTWMRNQQARWPGNRHRGETTTGEEAQKSRTHLLAKVSIIMLGLLTTVVWALTKHDFGTAVGLGGGVWTLGTIVLEIYMKLFSPE